MTHADNDLDRAWAALLEVPPPPLATAEETLHAARIGRRRRTAVTAIGSGAAAVAVVAVSVAVAAAFATPRAPATTADDRPAVPPAEVQQPLPPPLPAAPSRAEAHAHSDEIGQILLDAVPSGYTGLLQVLSTDGTPGATWQVGNTSRFASTTYVVVTTGQADGLLKAHIAGGQTGLGDDLCGATVNAYLPSGSPCDIVTVNGIEIRVSSATDPERGQVNLAIRLLDGGLLVVEAQQGIPVHGADGDLPPDAATAPPTSGEHSILGGWPNLAAVPLTTAELSAIAANPDMLP